MATVNAIKNGVKTHCKEILDSYSEQDDGLLYCDGSWDNFSCWPRTLAGTTASVPCPSFLNGINAAHNATKYCHRNGTWSEKAMYNLCVGEEQLTIDEKLSYMSEVRVIYNIGFWMSTVALLVALFIFLYFRSLHCLRNTIHCHLIVTYIMNNTVWIIMRYTLTYAQNSHHSWLCKSLTSISNFAQVTNFFWMFVEGLYLHIIIVWTYSADKIRLRYLVLIGWGLPTVIMVLWIIVRTKIENNDCWLPMPDHTPEDSYDFIFNGPIIFVLLANIIYLSTIVWVLITKLRSSNSQETRQYRKAVRATVILFPLLGIPYVMFITPPIDHPSVKIIFKFINAVLQSIQGFVVAVFYCFLNGEVKEVLKKTLSQFNDARSLSSKYTRASYGWTRGSRKYANTIVTLGN